LTNRIVIDDVRPSLFECLLVALYTDELPPTASTAPEDLLEMLNLCRRFTIPTTISTDVMSKVKSQVKWGVNVITVIAKAYEMDLPDVIDMCLTKVTHSLPCVKAEFMHSHASSEGMCVVFVAKARMAVVRHIRAIMKGVRLPQLEVSTIPHNVQRQRAESYTTDQTGQYYFFCDPYQPNIDVSKSSDIKSAYAKVEGKFAMFNELGDVLTAELDASMEQLLSAADDLNVPAVNMQRKVPVHQSESCLDPVWRGIHRILHSCRGSLFAVQTRLKAPQSATDWWDDLANGGLNFPATT